MSLSCRIFKLCPSSAGQRDFAAAVLLPHAAAAAAALQRQSAVVVLAAYVELLGITVINGFNGVGALYSAVCGSMAAPKHMQTLGSGSRQHSAAAKLALCSGTRGIFSGTKPYAAAPLQLSAALTNGNTAAITLPPLRADWQALPSLNGSLACDLDVLGSPNMWGIWWRGQVIVDNAVENARRATTPNPGSAVMLGRSTLSFMGDQGEIRPMSEICNFYQKALGIELVTTREVFVIRHGVTTPQNGPTLLSWATGAYWKSTRLSSESSESCCEPTPATTTGIGPTTLLVESDEDIRQSIPLQQRISDAPPVQPLANPPPSTTPARRVENLPPPCGAPRGILHPY
ncbi:hypothetical protein B0H13DRAFT_1865127 [Mycena leptocephala]|nr:hypothetical protein B0H13DRAFT_1865127 [Mycena leptocephala]